MNLPNVITPLGVQPGGEVIERQIPGVGLLRFENYGPGQWATKKGEPAKTSRRRYLLNGNELDSVSSIVDTLRKQALERWIERQATIGAVHAERLGELHGVPEEDWPQRVRSLNLGASAKRDEGADRGTVIHEALHTLAVEGRVPNPAEIPALARPWLQGAIRAWQALGVTEVLAAEEIVCHPDLGYAGRPDLVVVAERQVTLLDYKSGKGKAYPEAHFQTRLYAMALAKLGVNVDRIRIVAIGDDGGFELVDCEADEVAASSLLVLYRTRKRIERAMRDQRALAKAVAA